MILIIHNFMTNHTKETPIADWEDLMPFVKGHPILMDEMMLASDLESATQIVAKYLSKHHIEAWVDNRGLYKNLKAAVAGLGLVASLMAMPNTTAKMDPNVWEAAKQKYVQTHYPAFGTQPEDRFLHTISQLESSGGKNVAHQKLKYGQHAGHSAHGKFALMPNTVSEMMDRMKALKILPADMKVMQRMNAEGQQSHMAQNPHLDLHLARFMAKLVLQQHSGDMARAAYSWKFGHNLTPDDITDEHLSRSGYVKDFMSLWQGKGVKGLRPAPKKFAAPTKIPPKTQQVAMNKSEEPFKDKLSKWKKKREEQNREIPFVDTTRGIDLGSDREPEFYDEQRSKLKQAVEEAKRINKP